MGKFSVGRSLEKLPVPVALYRSPSSTRPGLFHLTAYFADGSVRCSCEGFCMHGHCWHLDEATSNNALGQKILDKSLEAFNNPEPELPGVAYIITETDEGTVLP